MEKHHACPALALGRSPLAGHRARARRRSLTALNLMTPQPNGDGFSAVPIRAPFAITPHKNCACRSPLGAVEYPVFASLLPQALSYIWH